MRAEWPSTARRIWCTTLGRGQWAAAAAAALPACQVNCLLLDLFQAEQASAESHFPNLRFQCQSDPDPDPCELVALPVSSHGDAELVREFLQSAWQLLPPGGQLWTATDNPRDHWLQYEVQRWFPRVSVERHADGILYRAIRQDRPLKIKSFRAEFAFRSGARLLYVVSRPGVFSHRRLDIGARALLETMPIAAGQQVLDLGCGSGAVTLAAAVRAERGHVTALDANPRAVECTLAGAVRNGLTNVSARLDASAHQVPAGQFDVVVANPPYYSRGRITDIFVDGAARALGPHGTAWFVTKDPEGLAQAIAQRFNQVDIRPVRAYWIVSARR